MQLPTVIAMALYAAGTFWFWQRIQQIRLSATDEFPRRYVPILAGWGAVVLHCWLLGQAILMDGKLNLALGNVVSLVSLMTVVVFLLATLTRDIVNLGLFVMPVGFLGLLVGQFFTGSPLLVEDASPLLWWHLGVALLAFGFLCMAAAQAVVIFIQDRHLHKHKTSSLLPALPAIQTMEHSLFRLTLIGVVLLTANLVIGAYYLYDQIGRKLEFNHHILLSFVAWLGFTALLAGHRIYGWRGETAARWTLAAFFVLNLAYFGTRFVTTIILS